MVEGDESQSSLTLNHGRPEAQLQEETATGTDSAVQTQDIETQGKGGIHMNQSDGGECLFKDTCSKHLLHLLPHC